MTAPANATAPVIMAGQFNGGPEISANPTAGDYCAMTNDGSWLNTPTSFTYQWQRDGVDIPGETVRAKYVMRMQDSGKLITCQVTATNVDGSGSASSNALGPVTTYFQQEVDEVDPTKILLFVVDTTTYGLFEFSYSGLTVTGGSNLACEYGASWLLDAMGFRWYAAPPWGTVRPTSINVGLTKAKSEHWMPTNSLFLVYGHSWPTLTPGTQDPIVPLLNNRQRRWCTLNSFQTEVWPVGHRWLNVVSNNKGFFANYPYLLNEMDNLGNVIPGNPEDSSPHYDLAHILPATADYDRLVQINAAYLLQSRLNEWRRTHFDPSDGDGNTSDQVFLFSKNVADLMRVGTPAISWPAVTLNGISYPAGGISAQAGVADCQIGVYAYASHRLPPTMDCKPGVYVAVALAFSTAGFASYQDLVAAHGDNTAAILLREYWDTETRSHSMPMANGRLRRGYFDWYDSFHDSGAIGVRVEFAANWWMNVVGTRYGIQKCKTGAGTWEEALDDIMAKLFSPGGVEDTAMRALLSFWGENRNRFNRLNLRRSCDLIAALPASWYKTFVQQWMIIAKKRSYLPPQVLLADQPEHPDDPFPAAFNDYMADVVGTRADEVIHSYAMARQDARGNVNKNYPLLAFEHVPPPDYYLHPTVFTPESTQAEFDTIYAQLQADTVHDPDLDDDDFVLVRGIKSTLYPNVYPEATHFAGRYNLAALLFVGPGKVIQSERIGGKITEDSEVVSSTYGPGVHYIDTDEFGYWAVTNEGGELFIDTLGGMYLDAVYIVGQKSSPYWLYVPVRPTLSAPPTLVMEAGVKWVFLDRNDAGAVYQLDLVKESSALYVAPTYLGPGQILVYNGSTGDFNNMGANRWMGKKENNVLLPKAFADEDFPKMARVVVSP